MTLLLYDYYDLEERAARHLRIWKAWHIILYACAAIFGLFNYIFLQNAMQLVDNNCVFYPRQLAFHMVQVVEDIRPVNHTMLSNETVINSTLNEPTKTANATESTTEMNTLASSTESAPGNKVKREVEANSTVVETTIEIDNVTVVLGNKTHRLMLDTSRTLFARDTGCEFAEYMPLLSTVFALMWITMFTMCPGGGRARSGLQQPWRILTPALLFSLVLVGLTGHSFSTTNGGLHDFCAAFRNVTNNTVCSSAEEFIELSRNATWGFAARVAATRGCSAGVWASWACAAALLLARCLAAPDFAVRRTGVYLVKDPNQKISKHLKKSRRSPRSTPTSPVIPLSVSPKSEATMSTELVTVEPVPKSPVIFHQEPVIHDQRNEMLEMTYTSQEQP